MIHDLQPMINENTHRMKDLNGSMNIPKHSLEDSLIQNESHLNMTDPGHGMPDIDHHTQAHKV